MIYTHLLHNFSTTCQRGINILLFFFSTFVHATRNPKRGSFKFHNPRFQRCQTASPFELSNFSPYRSTRRVAKIMKREKQKTYNRNTAREREGVAPMGGGRWVLVAGERGNSPLLFVATDPAKEREIIFYGRRRRQIRPPNLPEWGRRTTEDAYRQERSRRRH
jgi:hypothetical protein